MATITDDDFSRVVPGTSAADFIFANGGNDTVFAGSGADGISGGFGNDTLFGEGDNDVFFGGGVDGAGNDTLDGGGGTDTVDYINATSTVIVHLGNGRAGSSALGQDTLVSIERAVGSNFNDLMVGHESGFLGFGGDDMLDGAGGNDQIFGRGGDDTLFGGAGNDVVRGEAFDDTLFGGSGDDLLIGDADNDKFFGGSGSDCVSYLGSTTGVRMKLGGSTEGDEGTDTFSGVERLIGSHFDDELDAERLAFVTSRAIEAAREMTASSAALPATSWTAVSAMTASPASRAPTF
jgi:Ca2+-binding RTX toxin-like protein